MLSTTGTLLHNDASSPPTTTPTTVSNPETKGLDMSEGGPILVRRRNQTTWTQPEVGSYDNEHHLQDVLAADHQEFPVPLSTP